MTSSPSPDATRMVNALAAGDQHVAEELMPLVYDEFRQLADNYLRQETRADTLQPTALVHEAYLKLIDQTRVNWQGRTHFFAVVRKPCGGSWSITPGAQLRASVAAAGSGSRWTNDCNCPPTAMPTCWPSTKRSKSWPSSTRARRRIVELRFFAGLTVEEVAEALGLSKRTVENEWTIIRAWLRRELAEEEKS